MKIGFIFPSSEYLHDPFRGDPHTHFQILTILEHHFGDRVDLSLIDLRGIKRHFAIYHIPECDVYLHSVYTLDYDEQVSIISDLRKCYPKAKHIAGGPHVSFFQEECSRIFDALVIGDGEESIIKVITDIMSLDLQKIYVQKSAIDINRYPYPLRKYLSRSAIARKGLLNMRKNKEYDQLLSTTVVFSRGCPFQCSFCAMPQVQRYGPGIRYRSPKLIEEEIEYLKRDYSIGTMSSLDDISVPLNNKEAIPHLEAIARTGIKWKGQARANGVTDTFAKLASEAGCIALGMGVESVSQRSLDMVRKNITIEQARNAISIIKENGIECRVYFIMGLPGEPDDIVEKTWEFIKETAPDMVYLSLFTVRPGTEVFNNPAKFGIKYVNRDWKKTMHMFGKYEHEEPTLTFEYDEVTPWGKGFSKEKIIGNYLELQARINENNLSSAVNKTLLV